MRLQLQQATLCFAVTMVSAVRRNADSADAKTALRKCNRSVHAVQSHLALNFAARTGAKKNSPGLCFGLVLLCDVRNVSP